MKYNKLIAEFMGVDKHYEAQSNNMHNQYHVGYNIMKVVDKIERLGFTTSIKTSYARINPREMGRYDNYISFVGFNEGGWHSRNPCPSVDDDIDNGYESKGHEIINKRQAIYKAVVAFINWYNKNK